MGVRRAVDSDLAAIHPLLEDIVPSELGRRRAAWSDAVAHEGYAAWVAEVDGSPAGFVDLFIFPDVAHGGTIGLINNLVVGARFRGRGLGGNLLQEAIDHSRRHGALELHVWTDFDNTRAIRLYERLGFVRRSVLLELHML